uniref:Fe2OG dioxygenase domain-containing protein n=2 Tax=Phaeomonas parva TaxID=124430 RepID=A0A7S1XMC5_9STRA|mmetsp:Transcript_16287/g.49793  ORF Transcript_16287/g.49793 Transcript_16287/m.49793 type:complete len:116 (+) Transcript_16287:267-614(+)
MLPGVELQQLEEPQVVRYTLGQKFGWHGDALPKEMLEPGGSDGGQRVGTLLVYLNDVENGGATVFRDLGLDGAPLKVQPKKGRALLFFPSDNGGRPDGRTGHQAEPALGEKWICQ